MGTVSSQTQQFQFSAWVPPQDPRLIFRLVGFMEYGMCVQALDRFIAPAQEKLWALARNLWWCWDHDTSGLFRDLDPVRWRKLNHNPVSLLNEVSLAELERRAGELMLHSRINYAYRRQQEYLRADNTWGATNAGVLAAQILALTDPSIAQRVKKYKDGLAEKVEEAARKLVSTS